MFAFDKICFCVIAIITVNLGVAIGQNIIVKPYIQNLQPTTVSIMWEADNAGIGTVTLGIDPFLLDQAVVAQSVLGNVNTIIHTAVIPNLLPYTKYYYKVRMASGTSSSLYHFTTYKTSSSEENINFVAVSDMQQDGSNPSVFTTLINQGIFVVADTTVEGGKYGLHGMLIPGDLVQNGGIYNEWKNTFFNPSENFSAFIPMYPVLGNHEYYSGTTGPATFLKYFDLPQNGPSGLTEQVWYKDFSNIRVFGLNSNTTSAEFNTQLTWLEARLNDVCSDPTIDFVFAQLHHPFHSELWTPGELGFTGQVIQKMEAFSQNCNKASIHFYGHTHAYSRGQSRDHQHLMVNVATAGGAIDNWGEFPNNDYPEYNISTDDYGFVLIQIKAGIDPELRLRRFTRGDNIVSVNNILMDEIILKNQQFSPRKPTAVFPTSTVNAACVNLRASDFIDPLETHQASHWQVAPTCGFTTLIADIWKQNVNWYNEINTQATDDLRDQTINGLAANTNYCWRVRYRDQYLKWSEWSVGQTFSTSSSTGQSTNLLNNPDAETGTLSWTGQIESLLSNECNSVPVYAGSRMFAVGGVCANESSVGSAFQNVDVSIYALGIDAGSFSVEYRGFMRAFANNNDVPQMYLQFFDMLGIQIGVNTQIISSSTTNWTMVSALAIIPSGTRSIKVILKGIRNSGTDNDSYFDNLSIVVFPTLSCLNCVGNGSDNDGDMVCSDIDCNDGNATIFPGAKELCDGLDNNCDGLIDSGNTAYWTGNGGTSDWHTGANWSQGFEPLPCQHVVISSGANVSITQNPTVASLEIAPTATLTHQTGSITNIGAPLQSPSQSLLVNGTIINNGKIYVRKSPNKGIVINGILQNNHLLLIGDNSNIDLQAGPSGTIQNVGELIIKN